MKHTQTFRRVGWIMLVLVIMTMLSPSTAEPAQASEIGTPQMSTISGTWNRLGSGFDNGTSFSGVFSLAIDKFDKLYAGGTFSEAGGVKAKNIAKWNGSKWSALGTGMDFPVYSLLVNQAGKLIAGGSFKKAGGNITQYIAEWNGKYWMKLGSEVFYGGSGVETLEEDKYGILYAGGGFYSDGGVLENFGKWDGYNWSPEGAKEFKTIKAIAVDSTGALYKGGSQTLKKWDGIIWSNLGVGLDGASWIVHDMVVDSKDNLYVGGWFTYAGGVSVSNIAKWDGSSWSSVDSGVNGRVLSLALDSFDNLYVGGFFSSASGIPANNIAMWDGNNWYSLGDGTNAHVASIAFDSQGILYIGGYFTRAGGLNANQIAKWSPPCYLLSMSYSGQGTVPTLSPEKSPGCANNNYYRYGQIVTLNSLPDVGWKVKWTGTDDDLTFYHTNTITMPMSAHSIDVEYVEDATCYTLSLSHYGNGLDPFPTPDISPYCPAGEYYPSEQISFTAEPNPGSGVESWFGTDNDSSHMLSNTLIMPPIAHDVSINYGPCYTLSFNIIGDGLNPTTSPLLSPGCTDNNYVSGQQVNIEASPTLGWKIESWVDTDDDKVISEKNSITIQR